MQAITIKPRRRRKLWILVEPSLINSEIPITKKAMEMTMKTIDDKYISKKLNILYVSFGILISPLAKNSCFFLLLQEGLNHSLIWNIYYNL